MLMVIDNDNNGCDGQDNRSKASGQCMKPSLYNIKPTNARSERDLLQDHLITEPGRNVGKEKSFYKFDIDQWVYDCAPPFTNKIHTKGHYAFVVEPQDASGNVGEQLVLATFYSQGGRDLTGRMYGGNGRNEMQF